MTQNNISIIAKDPEEVSFIADETGTSEHTVGQRRTSEADVGGMARFFDNIGSIFGGEPVSRDNVEVVDSLTETGLPVEQAQRYQQEVDSGRILILADADGQIDTNWNDRDTRQERSMPVREEQLDVYKDRVETGEVRLHKDVVEEQKTINVPVSHEEVYVERRPASHEVDDSTPIGQTDDEVIRMPVVEERVEVTKRPVVTGEVVVGKREVEENQQVRDTIKREEVRMDHTGDAEVTENNTMRGKMQK